MMLSVPEKDSFMTTTARLWMNTNNCKCSFMTKWKGKLETCLVLLLAQLTLIVGSDVENQDSGDDHDGVTITVINWSSTQNATTMEGQSSKNNTGTVVAVSVICVLVCIAVIFSVYFFRRKRHTRMMDKEKKMQIQMSSARNAGVYQDLTVSVPVDDRPPASPEHERLKAGEDA